MIARAALLLTLAFALGGCIAVKAVDTAAGAAIGVTKGTVKATGKVVGAAIPDGDKEDDED